MLECIILFDRITFVECFFTSFNLKFFSKILQTHFADNSRCNAILTSP